jgi:hypothetical protein
LHAKLAGSAAAWRSDMTTGAVAQGCPGHQGFDPLSLQYLADPFAVMAVLPLDEKPVFFAPPSATTS